MKPSVKCWEFEDVYFNVKQTLGASSFEEIERLLPRKHYAEKNLEKRRELAQLIRATSPSSPSLDKR